MAVGPPGRFASVATVALIGVAIGGLVGTLTVYEADAEAGNACWAGSLLGACYDSLTVSVPENATATVPYIVLFHGATFSMWWPYVPPNSASTGVIGVSLHILEPSGTFVETGTGCAACDRTLHTWYSPDGSVGVGWHDASLGDLTLLVRA